MVFSAFEPKTPAALPTPDAVFQAARATNSDLVFVAPAFIEVCYMHSVSIGMRVNFLRHGHAILSMSSGSLRGRDWQVTSWFESVALQSS